MAAGVLATTLATAAAGTITGGLLGALVDYGVSPEHADVYAENVRRGGTLVSVKAEGERLREAEDIMQEYDPVDIGARGETYRKEGWSAMIPTLPVIRSAKLMKSASVIAPDTELKRKMGRSRHSFLCVPTP